MINHCPALDPSYGASRFVQPSLNNNEFLYDLNTNMRNTDIMKPFTNGKQEINSPHMRRGMQLQKN